MFSKFVFSFSIILFLAAADAKPFKRVVVLSGGGFQFLQHLGTIDALEESNMKPDLIVASCGGSLAAMIIANLKTREQRREFLYSDRLKQLLRGVQAEESLSDPIAGFQFLNRRKHEAYDHMIPNVFNDYLVRIPNPLPIPEFNTSFSSASIPVIIVAGKVLFTPEEVGQKIGRKLFREVIFTSPSVANYLNGIRSPVALATPSSSVEIDTEIITNVGLADASRAAITNPMVLTAAQINEDYFVGGSINLYPLELARSLGAEVIMSFGESFGDSAGVPVVGAAYQFDPNERLLSVNDQYADWWIDATDREKYLESNYGFGIKTDFLKTYFRIPSDNNTFDRDVTAHFNYGRERMLESLRQGRRNYKCHVRYMDDKNASPELRKLCGR